MLSIEHATKLFGSVIGVNDVTVEFGPGAHGLLGPNGAGKTTLLGLVTGQLRPTMGQVRVFGGRPFGSPDVLRRIGFCPAADLTERRATPREWVRYLVRLSGFRGADTASRADRALEAVGLAEAADRPLGTLSKGMRQRAKLAGAMAHDPELLVLDEPFEGLDPASRSEMVDLLNRLNREHGVSFVIATHDVQLVSPLADRVYVLKFGGEIVARGTPSEVFQNLELLRTTNIEPPVLADLFQRLEARGHALGRPDSPEEAAERLLAWLEAERAGKTTAASGTPGA